MSKAVKASKYSGKLNEPIKWPGPSTSLRLVDFLNRKEGEALGNLQDFTEMCEQALLRVNAERLGKLPLLLEHYKIDKTLNREKSFMLLALNLAEDWVPGFKIASNSSSGRKKDTWPAWAKIVLLRDVKILKQRMGLKTNTAAIKELIKRARKQKNPLPIYASHSHHPSKAHIALLSNELSKIKNSAPELILQAAMDEMGDKNPLFERFINYFENEVPN